MIVQAGFNKAGIVNKKYYSPWMAAAASALLWKRIQNKIPFLGNNNCRAAAVRAWKKHTSQLARSLLRSQHKHTQRPGSMRIFKTPASQPASESFICRRFLCQKKHCGAPQWARDPKWEEIKPFYCQRGKMMHVKRLGWNWFETNPQRNFLSVRAREAQAQKFINSCFLYCSWNFVSCFVFIVKSGSCLLNKSARITHSECV